MDDVSHGERIERLLTEIQGSAGPTTWQRVEELVHRLVSMYGEGLVRLIGHVQTTGANTPALRARLASDELLSNLLILHGLHPSTTEERVQAAIDRVSPYLRSHKGGVELVEITDDARVRLRMIGTCGGCPSSSVTVDNLLRQAIEEAAPEVTGIEVADVGASTRPSNALRWIPVEGVERLQPGKHRVLEVEGNGVLFARVDDALVAYRNACASCGGPLEQARWTEEGLECIGCSTRFDLTRAGRAVKPDAAGLEPVPLLVDAAGARVGWREAAR